MGEFSKIGWTDGTGNLWWGCTEVHEGCDNCYARVLDNRWDGDHWGTDKPRRAIKSVWRDFRVWQQKAAEEGVLKKVFVGSMMDIAERPMPIVDVDGKKLPGDTGTLRDKFFNEVVPASPNLIFLLLSKRPSNFNKYIPKDWVINGAPHNVWFGTSPVNQETADKLIPQLLKVKGKRFLSIEPQLDYLDVSRIYEGMQKAMDGIDWVIVGGESGHGKRPFNSDWARHIRNACKSHNVPFFMKQIDKVQPIPEDLLIREFPKFEYALNNS